MTRPFRRIVWPLAVAETVVWAAMYYSFPALLPAWERDLGWSKTELSGAFTLALVFSAALAPVAGRLIDHGYGRQVFAGGALLGAVMLVLLSQVTALWQFYAVWLGLGVAMSSSLYEACFALLTRAMGAEAKRAITLVTLVAGFAGTLSFPSAHGLASAAGWRVAVLVFAIAVLVVAVPLIWTGCRHAEAHGEAGAPAASRSASRAMEATRTAAFWLLAFSFAMIALEHGVVITHLLPMLDDRMIPPDAAVLVASMIGPMQVAGRLAMVAAERYLSTLAIALGCYIAMGLAPGALFGAGLVPGLVIGFVILQGAGVGISSIIRPVVIAELLGRRNFGVVSGLLAVPYMGGYAASPTVAALVWEAGGYDLVLLLAILAPALGLLALLAAWRAAAPPRGEAS
jgi:MFS family permease